jgi:hypothetical protein
MANARFRRGCFMGTALAGRRKLNLGAALLGQATEPPDAGFAGQWAGAAGVAAPPLAGGAPLAHAVDAALRWPAAQTAMAAVGGVVVQVHAVAVATRGIAARGGGTEQAAPAAIGRVVLQVLAHPVAAILAFGASKPACAAEARPLIPCLEVEAGR